MRIDRAATTVRTPPAHQGADQEQRPEVLGLLPFSDELDTYASVLIAVIFVCLPLSDDLGLRGFGRGTASFSAYSMAMYTLQVGLGMLLALLLLGPVFDTPDGLGCCCSPAGRAASGPRRRWARPSRTPDGRRRLAHLHLGDHRPPELGEATSALFPSFTLPTFVLAFVVGLVVRAVLQRTPAWAYTDARTIKSISGVATDVLIVCGIASIVPRFVADSWLPLTILSVVGLAFCFAMVRWVAPRVMHGAWFEKALFTWGWATGSVATSIALLRMVDPDLDSRTLEDFGSPTCRSCRSRPAASP